MRKAKRPSDLGLTHHDRQRLRRALSHASDARAFRRIQAVLLFAEGWPIEQIAHVTAASLRSVYHWIGWYLRDHEVEILSDLPRPGRPAVAAVLTDARVKRELERDPLRLGYTALNWTAPLLATHLGKRYGCEISADTVRRRMR